MSKIEISIVNPVYYRPIVSAQPAQYNSRHTDSFLHLQSLQPWQYPKGVLQPWQRNDSIRQQVISDVGPITMRLHRSEGLPIEVPFVQKQQDRYQAGRFIYESIYAVSNLQPGIYKPVLTIGGIEVYEAECFWIKDKHEGTLLAEYDHGSTYQNFRFTANDLKPSIRFFGSLFMSSFASTDAIYTNEEEDSELLSSVPYDIHRLFINGPEGTPVSFAKRMFRILGCEDLMIEGRYFVKSSEGGTFEKIESEDGRYNPLQGWSIELRDRINRDSFEAVDNLQQVRRVAVTYVVDPKGFSNDASSGHIGTILNYE